MKFFWRWWPHDHGENALFAGGVPYGADYCNKCGRFHIWMTERLNTEDLIVIMHFYGYGKALKSRYDPGNRRDQVRGWAQGWEQEELEVRQHPRRPPTEHDD